MRSFSTYALAFLTLTGSVQAIAQTAAPENQNPESRSPQTQGQATPETKTGTAGERIEVRGRGLTEEDQRRYSTAAKIVIGREQIEQFGDSSLSEVLRRLPGISLGGPPGRGGPPRMRGLGAGYTQLLIDGQRTPPGFSIDSLTPEQIERIEILRAPSAETGARAIGGTINIITREGFVRRLNDLRAGTGLESGRVSPGLSWTYNNSHEQWIYNVSMSAFRSDREDRETSEFRDFRDADDAFLSAQRIDNLSTTLRHGLNLTGRLEQRAAMGETTVLIPSVFHAQTDTRRTFQFSQLAGSPVPQSQPSFDAGTGTNASAFTIGRLNSIVRRSLGQGMRLELQGGGSAWQSSSEGRREEFDRNALLLRSSLDDSRIEERSLNLVAKISQVLDNDHSLVSGVEWSPAWREESRVQRQGRPQTPGELPAFFETGESQKASSQRLAAYVQDEWSISPRWSASAGLRWEGIRTRGEALEGDTLRNLSSVWTPLFHTVWKPDENARDQIRLSLTRSYKAPALSALIGRTLDLRFPLQESNTALSPDRAGNPALKPELATGIDLAFEKYLREGGSLSINLFHRQISDYMRNVTRLERVSWSPAERWVSRMQNVGNAFTQGVELEAKFRLDQWIAQAPRTEVRSNLSVFRSEVSSVPGPDNRLDEQARLIANLGADHRLRSAPLRVGGNLNFVPGYRTRTAFDTSPEGKVSETVIDTGLKRVWDAYALWILSPTLQIRFSGNNLHPLDFLTGRVQRGAVDPRFGDLRQELITANATFINWRIQLEAKL